MAAYLTLWYRFIPMFNYFKKTCAHKRFTPKSSAADISLSQNVWIVQFGWLIPMCVALAVYHVCINNYFTFDDFMWLDRGRTFTSNWSQIFQPDAPYFDPLVHLMFVVDFFIAGLDPRWYHCVDITFHAANSLLVYRFVRLLSGDESAALYGGIVFAGSFAIADAVLWSSSRVDLLATFFSLGALIQFLHYLRKDQVRNLIFAFLLLLLALGAKGTPLILPIIFFLLIFLEKKPLRYSLRLIPFGALIILFVVLQKLAVSSKTIPIDQIHPNIGNLALAFCTLFIPESTLSHLDLFYTAPLLFIVVSVLAFLTFSSLRPTVIQRRVGYCILLVSILPVLITTDFKLATTFSNLQASPSHRIYLASVGTAILGGGLLRSIELLLKNFFPKFAAVAIGVLLAGVVTCDALVVKDRDKLWETEGIKTRAVVDFMLDHRGLVAEGSQIGLIKFPGSRLTMELTMKECLGVTDATFNDDVIIRMLDDPKILLKAEKSSLFIFGSDGHIYDKSQAYRQQLLLSRRAVNNLSNPDYVSDAQTATFELIREIGLILGL